MPSQDCTSSSESTTCPTLKLFLTGAISDRWNVWLLHTDLNKFQTGILLMSKNSCIFNVSPPRTQGPSMGWSGNFFKFPTRFCDSPLSREIFPETLSPTTTHKFFSLLHQKGLLRRIYTQNIDALEVLAGIPPEKIIGGYWIMKLPFTSDPILICTISRGTRQLPIRLLHPVPGNLWPQVDSSSLDALYNVHGTPWMNYTLDIHRQCLLILQIIQVAEAGDF